MAGQDSSSVSSVSDLRFSMGIIITFGRALSVLFSAVDETVFSRIMTCETAKQILKSWRAEELGSSPLALKCRT
ncbi:hypothetical protein M569_13944 [Genlisea aurea]|uniref:Uncharacterized protein n=1 Tax=Genlisea aurea TaxID=192259 RepID=S8DMK9_9LAMI|nr:hypothetical protein M569_13944 [Genlisea aurea]